MIKRKGILSRTVKMIREAIKRRCAQITGQTLGRRSFPLFGVPCGVEWEIEKKEGRLTILYPSLTLPKNPSSIDRKLLYEKGGLVEQPITLPDHGILTITQGIATYKGGNLSKRGKLISTFLEPIDGKPPHKNDLFYFSTKRFFPRIFKAHVPVITLAAARHWTFYHWVFEVLPRIHLAEKAGYPLKNLYVETKYSFQRESLALLGIDPKEIIGAHIFAAVEAPEIIIPSLPGPTPWACQFLRERMIPQFQQRSPIRLYISRGDAQTRRILNETEVISLLRRYGFTIVTLSSLTFKEQAELFMAAEIIVGPHGAGFSHLVFCQPKTRVLEFFSPVYVNTCYCNLSDLMDLKHHYLFCDTKPDLKGPSDPDIYVDLETLKDSLELMNIR